MLRGMPALGPLLLAAAVLVLAPAAGAADPALEVDPVPVTVPVTVPEPVLVVEPGTVSIGVGDETLVEVEAGSIGVGGSEPAPGAAPTPVPTSAPAAKPTPTSGSGAGGSEGSSQTSSSATVPVSSVITTSAGQSVSAQRADRVRITKVRYVTKNVHRTGRVTMIVTVKDRRGLLVRGAKVRIRGVAKASLLTLKGTQAKTTSKIGQATFTFKLDKRVRSKKSVGKRFVVASVATTPAASTSLVTSFRMPAARAPKS